MCCDAEQTKWTKAEAERKAREAAEDPRDRLRRLESPLTRQILQQLGDERALAALDAEIADAKAACDVEYARQFPNGPQPIFSISSRDEMSIALLGHVAHFDVLTKAFGPDGGGVAEIEDRAAEAMSLQSLHNAAIKVVEKPTPEGPTIP